MADTGKFGTFGGVFTPSILTILGVIMYLRLPAIVGQAGLVPTIGILLVAHLISVTTGLSVSCIATDRRVEAGGTYYMISRALGLPIGGTLGIALFAGLSFSVSLYLIGFAESFLGYWDLEVTKSTIRLAGTAVLLAVTAVTLVSTSLAIRTQYFIMAAIGLSLVSILLGRHGYAPAEPFLYNPSGTVPLMVLFGIFFPAVTGFEAGVSMSGDLRDPKRSIPLGAVSAIAAGLVVYIILALFFSHTVDRRMLAGDPQVLLKISLVPQLVIAGIWGATLSSAFGSILGAPRILQAAAQDRVAPKFFAKRSGNLQEPRRALMLTFLIAEGGILVGELDVIARIVSIFFIMTYGFINLSAAFKTATSAEFRPEFRTPAWVGFLGAAACLLVMIQLDLPALFAATLLLGLLFLAFKRRELTLESGDAWSGVWARVVRAGLAQLGAEKTRESNWRPNILVFSGKRLQRRHLVEFGKAVCGRLGLLSSFEFVQGAGDEGLSRSDSPPGAADGDRERAFSYRYHCPDIYGGMERVSRIYGFYGIEPNTILMGWSRNPENRAAFSRLLASYHREGFSVLLMYHNAEKEFGAGGTVDLWWDEGTRNPAFAFVLLRYLVRTPSWDKAMLRLLVINPDRSRREQIHRALERILEDYRLEMDIRIIDNQDKDSSACDIIRRHSAGTDLTLIGLGDEQMRALDAVFPDLDGLLADLGTAAVIHGAPDFENLEAGLSEAGPPAPAPEDADEASGPGPDIPVPPDPALAGDIRKALASGTRVLDRFYEKAIRPCFDANTAQAESFRGIAASFCGALRKALQYTDQHRYGKALLKVRNDYAYNCRRLFEEVRKEIAPALSASLDSGIGMYIDWFARYRRKFPRRHRLLAPPGAFAPDPSDTAFGSLYKAWKRARHRLTGGEIPYSIGYRRIAAHYLSDTRNAFLASYLQELYEHQAACLSRLKSLIFQLMDATEGIRDRQGVTEADVRRIQDGIAKEADDCIAELGRAAADFLERLHREFRENLAGMARQLAAPPVGRLPGAGRRPGKEFAAYEDLNRKFPEQWTARIGGIANKILLDILVAALRGRAEDRVEDFRLQVAQQVDSGLTHPVRKLEAELGSMLETGAHDPEQLRCEADTALDLEGGIREFRDQIVGLARTLPEELPAGGDGGKAPTPAARLVERMLESRLVAPVEEFLATGSQTLRETAYRVTDLVNLARFSLKNIGEGTPDPQTAGKGILEKTLDSVAQERAGIEAYKASLKDETARLLADAFDPLSPEKIEKSSAELSEMLRGYAGQKVLSAVGQWKSRAVRLLERGIIRILYSRSEGLLLARRLQDRETASDGAAGVIRLVGAVSPDPGTLEAVPRFYYNLFSSRSSIGTEFFIERPDDEAALGRALGHYAGGHRGGILVLGERNAGKTAFCIQAVPKLLPKSDVVHLFAPDEGTAQVEDLARALAKATGRAGAPEEIVGGLPHGTVLVVHDLELWFEQRRGGTAVIRALARMIDGAGDRVCFIVNSNPHSFARIDAIEPIGQRFIATIHLAPFSTEELKELILQRHHSSGLQFRWKGRPEKKLSALRIAALFDAYFNFSRGNPGVALQAWIRNIERAGGSVLDIRAPEVPDLAALRRLDADVLVTLGVCALHKRLDADRLGRITGLERPVLETLLRSARRYGLIEERSRGVCTLNTFLEPFIIQVLIEKRIL